MFRFALRRLHVTIAFNMRRFAMRWSVWIGAVFVAGILTSGDIKVVAASQSSDVADKQTAPSVDVELVIAVDVSYSMDWMNLRSSGRGMPRRSSRKNFCRH